MILDHLFWVLASLDPWLWLCTLEILMPWSVTSSSLDFQPWHLTCCRCLYSVYGNDHPLIALIANRPFSNLGKFDGGNKIFQLCLKSGSCFLSKGEPSYPLMWNNFVAASVAFLMWKGSISSQQLYSNYYATCALMLRIIIDMTINFVY